MRLSPWFYPHFYTPEFCSSYRLAPFLSSAPHLAHAIPSAWGSLTLLPHTAWVTQLSRPFLRPSKVPSALPSKHKYAFTDLILSHLPPDCEQHDTGTVPSSVCPEPGLGQAYLRLGLNKQAYKLILRHR